MQLPSEVESLKSALDELVEAHEGFDRAAFMGSFETMVRANMRLENALRRAKFVRSRFESASLQMDEPRALLHEGDDLAELGDTPNALVRKLPVC